MFLTNSIFDTIVVLNRWEHLRISEQQDVSFFMQHINDVIRDLKPINLMQSLAVIV